MNIVRSPALPRHRAWMPIAALLLVSACAGTDSEGGILRTACADSAECAEGLICIGGACLLPSCAVDAFFDTAVRACSPCADGFVSSGGDVYACAPIACEVDQYWTKEKRACLACDAGTRSEGGAVTACVAIDCALDTRWGAVGRACVTCEPGTFSAGGGADVCEPYDCVLDESWNADLRQCVPCARGTFSAGGASACTPIDCALDHAWRSDVRSCFPCTEGEVSDGGFVTTCDPIDCPRDSYWDAPRRGCFTCPTAHTSPGGASTSCAPVTCDRDTFWDRTTGECLPCPTGTTSAGGAVTTCFPIDCPTDSAWDAARQLCSPCPSGSISDGGLAVLCTPIDCARGQRWSAAQRLCVDCDEGMFSPGGTSTICVPIDCGKGERWDAASFACVACDAGYTTSGGYVTTCEDIDECLEGTAGCSTNAACTNSPGSYTCGCDDGFWGDGVDCKSWTVCAAGTDVSRAGTSIADRSCEACDPETFSTTTNVAACTPWTQTACAPGQVYAAGSATSDSTCTQCAAGSSSDGKGACQACGPERWSADGAPSCKTWTTCSVGQYVSHTPNATGDRGCTDCATGTFSTEQNAPACTPCATGTYASTTGATSCTAWTTCVSGQYASNTPSTTLNRTCANCTAITNCASGLSCTSSGNQVCGTCVANYSGSGTNQCYVNCLKGSSWNGTACLACPSGQTSAGGSVTSCTNINCAAGQYWDSSQQSCVVCPSGQSSAGGAVTTCTLVSLTFSVTDFDTDVSGAPVTVGVTNGKVVAAQLSSSGATIRGPLTAYDPGGPTIIGAPYVSVSRATGHFAVKARYQAGADSTTTVDAVRVFGADGAPLAAAMTFPAMDSYGDLSMDDAGVTVHVSLDWRSYGSSYARGGPNVHIIGANGALTAQLDMTSTCTGYKTGTHVSIHPTSGVGVVSCQSDNVVLFRRFTTAGQWLDPAGIVGHPSGLSSWYDSHSVSMTPDGGVVVVWTVYSATAPATPSLRAAFFNAQGSLVTTTVLGSTTSGAHDTFRNRHVKIQTVSGDLVLPYFADDGGSFRFNAYAIYSGDGVWRSNTVTAFDTGTLVAAPGVTWSLGGGKLTRNPVSFGP